MVDSCKYNISGFLVCSATTGGILDRAIQAEESKHGDFLRLVRELWIGSSWLSVF